jgi:hypothetical protein
LDDRKGIRVQQTFEMMNMPLNDDDSEKNLVATSWIANCSSHEEGLGRSMMADEPSGRKGAPGRLQR